LNSQALTTLGDTVAILLVPSILGALLARSGDGRKLWIAAAAALALTLLGLGGLTSGRTVGILSGLGNVLVGSLASFVASCIGLLVALAACATALVRSWRAQHVAWFLALLLTAALPLLAAVALFDYTSLVLEPFHGGEPVVFQGEQLAFALLPIGPAVLVVHGVWVALTVRRRG
jgi:hypothetical protein